MLEKCVLTVLELNWNKRLGHKKTKLNICHHMLTSSTQLQNRSFHIVERTRTSSKCQKMKYASAKRAKILFSIVKYANLWGFCCRHSGGCLSSLLRLVSIWSQTIADHRKFCNHLRSYGNTLLRSPAIVIAVSEFHSKSRPTSRLVQPRSANNFPVMPISGQANKQTALLEQGKLPWPLHSSIPLPLISTIFAPWPRVDHWTD